MTQTPSARDRRRFSTRPLPSTVAGVTLSAVLFLPGCAATVPNAAAPAAATAAEGSSTSDPASVTTSSAVFDAATIHTYAIEVDPDALKAMLTTYASTQDKEWVEATVTIDGQTFERAGIRLKGNSSLRSVNADTDPTALPLLIRLDKYVDDQSLGGFTEFILRSSSTATSINEAVSLDLLRAAGLASERAVAAKFTVNGSEAKLRLVVENLDQTWQDENFSGTGILYKAEAEGDYSYRGTDPASYADVFDQETGKDNLTPLIEFLDFVNNSSDEQFAAELSKRLDVEAFARYLAFEDLVDNFDDIDGPGNNSYLYWDADSGRFTVVAWDHNLAFGARSVGGGRGAPGGMPAKPPAGQGEAMPGRQAPAEIPPAAPPDLQSGTAPGQQGAAPAGVRGMSRSNPLAQRFLAVQEFASMQTAASTALRKALVSDGVAAESLEAWVSLVKRSDLVDASTVDAEAKTVSDRLSQLASGS